jgi:hypothetical protein
MARFVGHDRELVYQREGRVLSVAHISDVIYRSSDELIESNVWMEVLMGREPQWGLLRGMSQGVRLDRFRASLMRIVGGQRTQWHGSGGWPEMGEMFPEPSDTSIYLNLVGELDLDTQGAEFRVQPNDILTINAVVYKYANPGFNDGFFWTFMTHGDSKASSRHRTPSTSEPWAGDPKATWMSGSHPYYDSEPSHLPATPERISLVKWDDLRRKEIAWFGDAGHYWGAYPTVGEGVHVRALRLPAGTVAELDEWADERLLLGSSTGAIEVTANSRTYRLGLRDLLAIPASTAVSCRNHNSDDAMIFEAW